MTSANPWNLPKREQEVVDHVSCGLSHKRVAAAMNISESGVRYLLSRALRRMGAVNSIRAAVLWDRFVYGREGAEMERMG